MRGTHLGLSEETETKIKQNYLDLFTAVSNPGATADDVWILKYLGTYGGSVVVLMTDSFSSYYAVVSHEIIDGIRISYGDSNKAVVWKDGSFYRLQEAYDAGLLVRDDIEMISHIGSMFWETEKQIRQDYVDTYVKPYDPKAVADRVWIECDYEACIYYSNGCTALMLWYGENGGTDGMIREVIVAGDLFRYDSEHRITAWKNGNFYELQEAYDLGLLTKDDIKRIAGCHKASYPSLYAGR